MSIEMNAADGRVQGQVALITGGARGQGAAHARLLAREGASVLVADVREAEAKAVVEDIVKDGHKAVYVSLDVTSPASWTDAVATAEDMFGKLDILVNNAGICTYASVVDCDDEEWNRVISVNQSGCFFGMRAAVPAIIRAGGGSIINIASIIGGTRGFPGQAAYAASKAAIVALTKSAALSYGKNGVRVNAIAPGAIDTIMTREEVEALYADKWDEMVAATPIPRIAQPEEISYTVLYLASNDSSYTTGVVIAVDGGLTA